MKKFLIANRSEIACRAMRIASAMFVTNVMRKGVPECLA